MAATKLRVRLLSFGLLSATLIGCGAVRNPDTKLGVPYRAQAPNSFDCGPASILMWRLYDGLSEVSQSTIGNYMGGSSCGVGQQDIANAVNFFTQTYDAYWDLVGENEQDAYFSRQITSIDNYTPVIAIISFNHAGVVNGGKWRELTNGGYQWDYVYFHDPQTSANDYYAADDWISANCPPGSPCEQIISFNAAGAWAQNYNTYNDDLYVRGSVGRDPGPIEH